MGECVREGVCVWESMATMCGVVSVRERETERGVGQTDCVRVWGLNVEVCAELEVHLTGIEQGCGSMQAGNPGCVTCSGVTRIRGECFG